MPVTWQDWWDPPNPATKAGEIRVRQYVEWLNGLDAMQDVELASPAELSKGEFLADVVRYLVPDCVIPRTDHPCHGPRKAMNGTVLSEELSLLEDAVMVVWERGGAPPPDAMGDYYSVADIHRAKPHALACLLHGMFKAFLLSEVVPQVPEMVEWYNRALAPYHKELKKTAAVVAEVEYADVPATPVLETLRKELEDCSAWVCLFHAHCQPAYMLDLGTAFWQPDLRDPSQLLANAGFCFSVFETHDIKPQYTLREYVRHSNPEFVCLQAYVIWKVLKQYPSLSGVNLKSLNFVDQAVLLRVARDNDERRAREDSPATRSTRSPAAASRKSASPPHAGYVDIFRGYSGVPLSGSGPFEPFSTDSRGARRVTSITDRKIFGGGKSGYGNARFVDSPPRGPVQVDAYFVQSHMERRSSLKKKGSAADAAMRQKDAEDTDEEGLAVSRASEEASHNRFGTGDFADASFALSSGDATGLKDFDFTDLKRSGARGRGSDGNLSEDCAVSPAPTALKKRDRSPQRGSRPAAPPGNVANLLYKLVQAHNKDLLQLPMSAKAKNIVRHTGAGGKPGVARPQAGAPHRKQSSDSAQPPPPQRWRSGSNDKVFTPTSDQKFMQTLHEARKGMNFASVKHEFEPGYKGIRDARTQRKKRQDAEGGNLSLFTPEPAVAGKTVAFADKPARPDHDTAAAAAAAAPRVSSSDPRFLHPPPLVPSTPVSERGGQGGERVFPGGGSPSSLSARASPLGSAVGTPAFAAVESAIADLSAPPIYVSSHPPSNKQQPHHRTPQPQLNPQQQRRGRDALAQRSVSPVRRPASQAVKGRSRFEYARPTRSSQLRSASAAAAVPHPSELAHPQPFIVSQRPRQPRRSLSHDGKLQPTGASRSPLPDDAAPATYSHLARRQGAGARGSGSSEAKPPRKDSGTVSSGRQRKGGSVDMERSWGSESAAAAGHRRGAAGRRERDGGSSANGTNESEPDSYDGSGPERHPQRRRSSSSHKAGKAWGRTSPWDVSQSASEHDAGGSPVVQHQATLPLIHLEATDYDVDSDNDTDKPLSARFAKQFSRDKLTAASLPIGDHLNVDKSNTIRSLDSVSFSISQLSRADRSVNEAEQPPLHHHQHQQQQQQQQRAVAVVQEKSVSVHAPTHSTGINTASLTKATLDSYEGMLLPSSTPAWGQEEALLVADLDTVRRKWAERNMTRSDSPRSVLQFFTDEGAIALDSLAQHNFSEVALPPQSPGPSTSPRLEVQEETPVPLRQYKPGTTLLELFETCLDNNSDALNAILSSPTRAGKGGLQKRQKPSRIAPPPPASKQRRRTTA
ncbi:hypothetical protein DIPPA_00155 [Diplonema papillatum]|nr:hypothetical protein DIPPA_00155 [Diplonema papillatum]